MMKQYIKPNMQVETMEVNQIICASITDSGSTPPQANTKGDIPDGDAGQAMSKGYITRFDVWDEKWPD